MSHQTRPPAGVIPIGIFFFFGAAAASLAAITLLWPRTALDRAWKLNPRGYAGLSAIGRWIGWPFLALAATLFLAGLGWIKRRRWGWIVGVVVIAVNFTADLVHLAMGDWKSAVGVAIAGLLLIYMTKHNVRRYFAT